MVKHQRRIDAYIHGRKIIKARTAVASCLRGVGYMHLISGALVLRNISYSVIAAAALVNNIVTTGSGWKCNCRSVNGAFNAHIRLHHARVCNRRVQLGRTRKKHRRLRIEIPVCIENMEVFWVAKRSTIGAKTIAVKFKRNAVLVVPQTIVIQFTPHNMRSART